MGRGDRFDARAADPDAPAPAPLGLDLRLTRERLGWPLEAVAEHLRIRLPYMQAMEEGRHQALPAAAYAIGFVRAYAKLLGLDPDDAARRFRAEAGAGNRRTQLDFPAPVPERGVPVLAVVAVGAVLVIGAYAAWYRMSGNERPGPETVQAVPERLAPVVAERPAPAPPQAALPPEEPQQQAAILPLPPEGPSVSPSSAAAAAPPPPVPGVAGSRITVRARTDSWILVKDSRGQVLLNRVLHVGETWPVPARPAVGGAAPAVLVLTTGNAGGTELLVDGAETASLGNDGAVRRDLPLDPDAIRDGRLAVNSTTPAFRVSPRNQ